MTGSDDSTPTIVERTQGRQGELALRAVGRHYEIISNGVFLMGTLNGESERLLVRLALQRRPGAARLLIGGLGVGFSLAEALRSDRLEHLTVVEIEPKIIEWGNTHLASFAENALSDPRVEVVNADLVTWLRHDHEAFDAICLDIDNGPTWTVTDANRALYADEGLALLGARLKPGGVLTIWSAAETPGFADALGRVFEKVETFSVPVPRGAPDFIYVAKRS